MSNSNGNVDQYWKKNIQIVTILLSIWFLASFGFGIIFANDLDQINFFGFKLGFWFAQQGSILIFVAIIFIYIRLMKKLDQDFKEEIEDQSVIMSIQSLTYLFVGISFGLYIFIAIKSRAGSTHEFYIAGKGVHPVANGMATAADWMSAASFI